VVVERERERERKKEREREREIEREIERERERYVAYGQIKMVEKIDSPK
jgi:hypothetical protein